MPATEVRPNLAEAELHLEAPRARGEMPTPPPPRRPAARRARLRAAAPVDARAVSDTDQTVRVIRIMRCQRCLSCSPGLFAGAALAPRSSLQTSRGDLPGSPMTGASGGPRQTDRHRPFRPQLGGDAPPRRRDLAHRHRPSTNPPPAPRPRKISPHGNFSALALGKHWHRTSALLPRRLSSAPARSAVVSLA